jgi:VWFA-related protein
VWRFVAPNLAAAYSHANRPCRVALPGCVLSYAKVWEKCKKGMQSLKMPRTPQRSFARQVLRLCLACLLIYTASALKTFAQDAKPASQSTEKASEAAPSGSDSSEMSTRDTPPTFKVRVNLVLVRAVVRDAKGKPVNGLKKEDFVLTDNRKPQVISTFSVETPESHKVASSATEPAPEGPSDSSGAIAALPQRFVAVVFDDTDMLMQDTMWVRNSADRLLSSLAASDRVGFYSTSGQVTTEFTQDREALKQTLLQVVPRPTAGGAFHDCPEISLFQADEIVNKSNVQAMDIATEDAVQCAFGGDETMRAAAKALAQNSAMRALSTGEAQIQFVYQHLQDVTKRLATMPGQRIMVFVSPGFIVTLSLGLESSALIDRANRSNIVINTIDARGLYTPDMGDIADPPHDSGRTQGYKSSYRMTAQLAQSDVLAQIADGTGGTFFHNRNDIDEGLREAAAAPAVSYLLGFSPQNLKIDGHYHTIKVSLAGKREYAVQARHGYFAPRSIADPAEAAKEEIQEALFSQDELRDLPIDFQTQFFKKDANEARLAVLTHVDVKGIRFRKAEGRNRDNLTIATAIFDENGNYVTGGEKIVEMKLLDSTFTRLSRSGFTLKSSFDIKPGTYLVRQVVRDTEGSQMAARNGAVSIPY